MLKGVGLARAAHAFPNCPFPQTHPDIFITDSLKDDVRGELSAAILQKLGEVKQGPSIHEELSYHTPTEQTQNFILVHRLSGP